MRDGKYGVIRAEQRVPVKMEATITVAGRNVPQAASVIDISPSGLGLTTGEPIAVGEMACVDLGRDWLSAKFATVKKTIQTTG